MSSRAAASRAVRKQYAEHHPEDPRHGTSMSFYLYWGCRCDKCRDYASRYNSQYRTKAAPHEGSVYRIEEHRAFKEPLCRPCRVFLLQFQG